MSERKTAAATLTERLGTVRADLERQIRDLEASNYNPSDEWVRNTQRYHDDTHHEVGMMFYRLLLLEPDPVPTKPKDQEEELPARWTID